MRFKGMAGVALIGGVLGAALVWGGAGWQLELDSRHAVVEGDLPDDVERDDVLVAAGRDDGAEALDDGVARGSGKAHTVCLDVLAGATRMRVWRTVRPRGAHRRAFRRDRIV